MKLWITLFFVAGLLLGAQGGVRAHCEIPCGIYDDQQRIDMIEEHITTIDKSVKMINQLSKASDPNYNQVARWVSNKEKHAQAIQEIVARYFLTQRLKSIEPSLKAAHAVYLEKLSALHALLVQAMKSKQHADPQVISALRESFRAVDVFFGRKAMPGGVH